MHDEVKDTLRAAIAQVGPALQCHVGQFTEPFLVWRKEGEQWHGEYQERPSLMNIFAAARRQMDEAGTDFLRACRQHHPEYGGMVGFPCSGRMNILYQPGFILGQVMGTLWTRYGIFQPVADAVEVIVQEFADFIDQPRMRLRFMAQLLNYRMEPATIALPKGLVIRRLSEQEVSDIHGGPLWQLGFTPRRSMGPLQYAIEGEFEMPKVFGDAPDNDQGGGNIRGQLDRAVLALRTFKEGQVGYDHVRFRTMRFCPIPLPSFGYGDLHIPFGQYTISNNEVEPLREHAAMVLACMEPGMEMACSRLADAQVRLRPHDRLVDAVIGLESLLLAGLRNEDRRGELKFRFSLHYSTLFGTAEERHRAFRVAKDLYDLRSVIAHGGSPQQANCRVGDERLSLQDAALRACEALRYVVRHFLPQVAEAPYKQPQFWERGYFGLPVPPSAVPEGG
jgi:hypothetical protein